MIEFLQDFRFHLQLGFLLSPVARRRNDFHGALLPGLSVNGAAHFAHRTVTEHVPNIVVFLDAARFLSARRNAAIATGIVVGEI